VGPRDYYYSVWYNHTHHTLGGFVPDSCCHALKADSDCQMVAIDQVIGPIYDEGKQTTQVGGVQIKGSKLTENPSRIYGASPAIWDHAVLLAARHR